VRHRCSAQSELAIPRRWLRHWGGVAAVAVACSLLAPAARTAVPAVQLARVSAAAGLPGADSPTPVAQLEDRAARLAKQYRGELDVLSGAEAAAKAAAGRLQVLDGRLAAAHRQLARLAAASYMGSPPDQALAFFGDGDPEQVLGRAADIEYLARQRDARQQHLRRLEADAQDARQTAQDRVAELRQKIDALAGQQQQVKRLLDKFRPQSPVIGDNITPRMRTVRDEVDLRFGPFGAIGCYRPGNDGEHPLGRACDFMLSSGGVMPDAASIQKGYDIAAWAQANAARLGIMYIIYRQRIWDVRMASSGWVPMEDRGSITANHYDHVHISVF
jgi:hypothetical protein